MRFIGIVIKLIVLVNILIGVEAIVEDFSEKEVIQNHVAIGERIDSGAYSVKIEQVDVLQEQVRVDVAMTVNSRYRETIHRDYGPLRFVGWSEGGYGEDTQLEVISQEEEVYIPRGRTKVISYVVEVPEGIDNMVMEYSEYSGRTYYEIKFDIPIK
ncbi:MAG: hypothetical protein ACRCTE_01415 [Cellulosilyticaceae bacterium]